MGLRVINKVYTDLEGRTGKSMQGNYMDKSIVQYDVEYDAKVELSKVVSVLKQGDKFTLTSGTWFKLIGAFKGAAVDFRFSLQGNATSTTIDYVNGAEMALIDSGNSQDGIKSVGFFQVTDAPELFEVDFNLLQNSQGGTRYSLIDGETQRFSAVLVNALIESGTTDNFTQLGNKSGGSDITSTIARLADSTAGNKIYSIILNYKNPLLFDPELYKADDCIGDYARIRVTAQRGNDNVFIDEITQNIGDTGYEDESLNGGASGYTLSLLEWTDPSANAMVALDPSQVSHFDFNITGSFTANHKYGIKLFRIPQDESEYKNKPLNLERNLSLCMNNVLVAQGTVNSVFGEPNEDGASFTITNFEVTNNTTDVDVVGDITPNAEMITLLANRGETDKDYKLLLTIDDTNKAYKDANTVNVLIDASNAVKNVIPLGAWGAVTDFELIDINSDILTGTPDLLIESNNRMNVTFTLPKNANFVNPWKSLTGQVVAERTNGERFILESFVYDISELSGERPTKILLIEYLQGRGKRLPTGSLFNEVSFDLYPTLDDANNFGVKLNYGFRIGFENWIELAAASDYFEGNKTNNWYNYSSDAEWSVKFELVLSHDDGLYTNTQNFGILNYDSSTGVVVYTYKNLEGDVLTKPLIDEITEVTAVYTTPAAAFLGNEFGVLSVRDTDGVTLGEISTIDVPLGGTNPLIPIAGETKLKLTVAGKDMIMVSNIDPSKIEDKDYTFNLQTKGDV